MVCLEGWGPGQNTIREQQPGGLGKKYVDKSLQTDTEHKDMCGAGKNMSTTSPSTSVQMRL